MQSLGQAVYRHICKVFKSSNEGVGKRELIREMSSRGYLPPVRERVDDALEDYLRMEKIVLVRGRYVKKTLVDSLA